MKSLDWWSLGLFEIIWFLDFSYQLYQGEHKLHIKRHTVTSLPRRKAFNIRFFITAWLIYNAFDEIISITSASINIIFGFFHTSFQGLVESFVHSLQSKTSQSYKHYSSPFGHNMSSWLIFWTDFLLSIEWNVAIEQWVYFSAIWHLPPIQVKIPLNDYKITGGRHKKLAHYIN